MKLTGLLIAELDRERQMTVHLRLLGAKVPSIYGPSADDKQFR